MTRLIHLASCWLVVVACAPPASAACADEHLRPDTTNLQRVRAAIVCLHNHERKAAGVPPLRPNALLDTAAGGHSADMVVRRYFEHESPDGRDPFQRMERAGYIRKKGVWNAGENIAWGSGALSTPRSIFDAWINSSGHRLTLLASDFSELGVGIALGAPSADYAQLTNAVTYTIDFGWRQSSLTPCPRRTRRSPAPARGRCRKVGTPDRGEAAAGRRTLRGQRRGRTCMSPC